MPANLASSMPCGLISSMLVNNRLRSRMIAGLRALSLSGDTIVLSRTELALNLKYKTQSINCLCFMEKSPYI